MTPRRAVQALLIVVPLVAFAMLVFAHRTMYDDGWIYLRIVKQLEAGHGPVFNTGQRVEAYTGPLWLAILTVADLVTPFRLEWIAVALGGTLAIAGMAFSALGATWLCRQYARDDAMLAPWGML